MNKMHKGVFCLIVLAAIAAVRLFSHSLALYKGEISELPESVRAVTTFNNCKMFMPDKGDPRRFRFSRDAKKSDGEAYLRFRIPKFDPSDYAVKFRIRARPELLGMAVLRTAISRIKCGEIKGDVMTFSVNMNESKTFVWSDGACYVGVGLPLVLLKDGDTVELLDFKFSLR